MALIQRTFGNVGGSDYLTVSDWWTALVGLSPLADDYEFMQVAETNEPTWPGGNIDLNGHSIRMYCPWVDSHQGDPTQGYKVNLSLSGSRLSFLFLNASLSDYFTIENIHIEQQITAYQYLLTIGVNLVTTYGLNIDAKNLIIKGAGPLSGVGLNFNSNYSKINAYNIKISSVDVGFLARLGGWAGVDHTDWHKAELVTVYKVGSRGIQTPSGDALGYEWEFRDCIACENANYINDYDWRANPLPGPANTRIYLYNCADKDGSIAAFYPNAFNCVGGIDPTTEFESLDYANSNWLKPKKGSYSGGYIPGSTIGISGLLPTLTSTDIAGLSLPDPAGFYPIGAHVQEYEMPPVIIQTTDIGSYMFIDTSAPINDFYVQSRGDDHWNAGGIDDPFRTLDKAMLEADSTIHIDGGHYDSFYLNLKTHNIELNQLYVYTSLPQHFISYVTLTAADMSNGFIILPTFVSPDDSCNVALNIVGGPAQNYGTDYIVEYGSLLWTGYVLEDFLDIGDTLRIVFEGPLQYKALNTLVLHQHFSNYEQEKAIFVSTSGSDSTVLGGDGTNTGGDGSIERPYRTISMALSQSSSGDNIVAMAGEYPIFNGLDDRPLIVGIDRTSVPDKYERRVYEEFFNPEDFRSYGTTEYDSLPWTLDYTGNSMVSYGGGFLSFTYDGTNNASAESSFGMNNDWEVIATLRNTIDPMKFLVTSPDNTAYFYYNDGDYTTGVVTGGGTYECDSSFSGLVNPDSTISHVTEYISLTGDNIRNKSVSLSFIPEPSDCSNVALNIVGGVSQNYGEDFYIENSMIKWNGMALDGELEAGEVFRIIYHDRNLSNPVKILISNINERLTIKAYDRGWNTVMARDQADDFTGPWIVNFIMDTASPGINHACIYGRGFVSKFSAVADSFTDNLLLDTRFDVKTERRTLILYEDRT